MYKTAENILSGESRTVSGEPIIGIMSVSRCLMGEGWLKLDLAMGGQAGRPDIRVCSGVNGKHCPTIVNDREIDSSKEVKTFVQNADNRNELALSFPSYTRAKGDKEA